MNIILQIPIRTALRPKGEVASCTKLTTVTTIMRLSILALFIALPAAAYASVLPRGRRPSNDSKAFVSDCIQPRVNCPDDTQKCMFYSACCDSRWVLSYMQDFIWSAKLILRRKGDTREVQVLVMWGSDAFTIASVISTVVGHFSFRNHRKPA